MTVSVLPISREILLAQIDIDSSPIVRAEMHEDVVSEYADNYSRNVRMPFIHVWETKSGKLLLSDGRHRLLAAEKAEVKRMICAVHKGEYEDCLGHAIISNITHGLRRSNADKRLCVELALKTWPNLSDRALAEKAGVDHSLVSNMRCLLHKTGVITPPAVRSGSDGRKLKPKRSVPPPQKSEPEKIIAPAPAPKGLNADTVPLILKAAEVVQELWQKHPTWHTPEFREVFRLMRIVRDDLQVEFTGMGKPERQSRFTPPTLEEIHRECAARKLPPAHADEFFNFYASKGWKVGASRMVNWKLALSRSARWESATRVMGKNGSAHSVQQELTVIEKEVLKQRKQLERL